jgi:hypothetical protein
VLHLLKITKTLGNRQLLRGSTAPGSYVVILHVTADRLCAEVAGRGSAAGSAPVIPESPAPQEADACSRDAVRLRREHRDSIVMWLAPENCFRAYRRMAGGRYLS